MILCLKNKVILQIESYFFRKGCEKLGIDEGSSVPATDEFLNKSQKVWYPDFPTNTLDGMSTEVPPDILKEMIDRGGAPAATIPTNQGGVFSGMSTVYFRDIAFNSAKELFYSMGHELLHVSQFSFLIGQPYSLTKNEIFSSMIEYYAYSYQNFLGGTSLSSWTKEDIIIMNNTFPQYFKGCNYSNFPWTYNNHFNFPF